MRHKQTNRLFPFPPHLPPRPALLFPQLCALRFSGRQSLPKDCGRKESFSGFWRFPSTVHILLTLVFPPGRLSSSRPYLCLRRVFYSRRNKRSFVSSLVDPSFGSVDFLDTVVSLFGRALIDYWLTKRSEELEPRLEYTTDNTTTSTSSVVKSLYLSHGQHGLELARRSVLHKGVFFQWMME